MERCLHLWYISCFLDLNITYHSCIVPFFDKVLLLKFGKTLQLSHPLQLHIWSYPVFEDLQHCWLAFPTFQRLRKLPSLLCRKQWRSSQIRTKHLPGFYFIKDKGSIVIKVYQFDLHKCFVDIINKNWQRKDLDTCLKKMQGQHLILAA